MSPRASSSTPSSSTPRSSASAPYRRTAAQPKSTRQQFSACGACRMRRVRCDLKDLNYIVTGPTPSCSNCKERNIKCVDEFADVKAVKLLRRGRRLQQVEAIYGKTASGAEVHTSTPHHTSIPSLHPDFFYSPFWRWFCIQRPILDAAAFSSDFLAQHQGEKSLSPEAGIITMLLVVWASTFGLNERGLPTDDETDSCGANDGESSQGFSQRRHDSLGPTQAMVQQVLELVDLHGILRRPSLDGTRVLLLLIPLMEDSKHLERQAVHDAALLHVQALCTTHPSPSALAHVSPQAFEDASIRARLFWYAFTQEGLVSGIRGSRFVLHTEDYEAFQRTMPHPDQFGQGSPPSPPSLLSAEAQQYQRLISASTLPSHLNMACRKIHNVLTGPRAQRRAEEHNLIDANGMREVWNDLDRCWREFDGIRRNAASNEDPASRCDTERYACAWLIFVFECHNVIRESLKHYSSMVDSSAYPGGSTSRPASVSSGSPYVSPQYLHSVATRRCMDLLPKVIRIMKHCINAPRDSARSGLFVWDSGLVRDGCFFAGYLAASADEDVLNPPLDLQQSEGGEGEPSLPPLSTDEAVVVCLNALSAMRWCYSKSEEREGTIRMVWEGQKAKRHGQSSHYPDMSFDATFPSAHSGSHLQAAIQPSNRVLGPTPTGYADRPVLPALGVFAQIRRAESAPSTAHSSDGQGAHGWPTYTPPGTATSITTSTSTALSIRGSPEFANTLPTSFKPQLDDGYYHGGGDLDHFAYGVPAAVPHPSDMAPSVNSFPPRHGSFDGHAMSNAAQAPSYASSHFSPGGGPIVASGNDYSSCPQFGENCNAHYH